MSHQNTEFITAMGFTQLEAEIYIYLLQKSSATGYGIAKNIGRTNANTYKAIQSLQAKGAVLVEEGDNRICRAVPAAELFDQLERSFLARKRRAVTELSKLKPIPIDDRVYQMTTIEQIYERCRSMLDSCTHSVILDLFPAPLAELTKPIIAAAERGIDIYVHAYEPVEIEGVEVTLHRQADEISAFWSTDWLSIVVDGAQYLIAMIHTDQAKVYQAIWSASPIISWVIHSYSLSDIQISQLSNSVANGATINQIQTQFVNQKESGNQTDPTYAGLLPGNRALLERFGLGRSD